MPSLRILSARSPIPSTHHVLLSDIFTFKKHAMEVHLKFLLLRALGRENNALVSSTIGLDFVNITRNDNTHTIVNNKKRVRVRLRNRLHKNTVRP